MSLENIKDRVPVEVLENGAIRYGVYDNTGNLLRYEYIKREDEPIEEGTPVNKALIDNIQGDLYTQDRYNIPRAGWLETDLYETTFTDNIFPSSWEKENDNSFYSADVLLTTSSARSGDYGPDAFTTDAWWTSSVTNAWIQIQFPQGIKITKMKLIMSTSSSSQTSTKKILGSKDGQAWVELYSTSGNVETSATVRTLSNADYYSYYKVEFTNRSSCQVFVKEWQVTQYKEKGVYGYELDLPLTSYEKGKIVNIEGVAYNGTTSFSNLYLNINNLGVKPINGTIKSGEKYTLVYNGNSWDVVAQIVAGSYTGNDSTSRTISLGFEPKMLFVWGIPNGDAGEHWGVIFCQITSDNKFVGTNGANSDGSWYDASKSVISITSNGFRISGTSSGNVSSGQVFGYNLKNATYYYKAFK